MRRKYIYFKRINDDPPPVFVRVKKRISFSEVDAMGIVWHGRYPQFFEMAAEKIGRKIGLSYKNYQENNLAAPIVQHHIDYFKPIKLEEKITIEAKLIWTNSARLNTEFTIFKQNSEIAATGYVVQMFVDSLTNDPCIIIPDIYKICCSKWENGEFNELQ